MPAAALTRDEVIDSIMEHLDKLDGGPYRTMDFRQLHGENEVFSAKLALKVSAALSEEPSLALSEKGLALLEQVKRKLLPKVERIISHHALMGETRCSASLRLARGAKIWALAYLLRCADYAIQVPDAAPLFGRIVVDWSAYSHSDISKRHCIIQLVKRGYGQQWGKRKKPKRIAAHVESTAR